MDFKNIEAIWAHAKSKMPKGVFISDISKAGSSKYFDLVVPKSLVKNFPEDSKKGDLVYSFSEVGGTTEVYLENNGLSMDVYDTADFREAVGQYLGLNESRINEQEIYNVEDTILMGYDKIITFGMWNEPRETKKLFDKITKDYHLDPLPDGEAMVYIKAKDEKKFVETIEKLVESKMNEASNKFAPRYDFEDVLTVYGRKNLDKTLGTSRDIVAIRDTDAGYKFFDNYTEKKCNPKKSTEWFDLSEENDYESILYVNKKDKSISVVYELCVDLDSATFMMTRDTYEKILAAEGMNESELQDKYQEFFLAKLKEYNVSSPVELSQEDRSKFFSEIKDEWKDEKKQLSESFPSHAVSIAKITTLSAKDIELLSTRDIERKLSDVNSMMTKIANDATEEGLVAYRELDSAKIDLLFELKRRGN